MSIEIQAIGGFTEIGRNCSIVKVDDEYFILDMGLNMEKYIEHTDSDDIVDMSAETLIALDAVPDVNIIKEKHKVKGIFISHAHLDHVGAIPFLAEHFDCPIYGSPFTMKVLKTILRDEKIECKNKIVEKKPNTKFKVTDKVEVEFVNVTHSTPQTVIICVHSKYGTVAYANDFKLDKHPTLGKTTNLERLREMDIKCLIVDCLYANNPTNTPSEMIAKQRLKEILLDKDVSGKNIFVTTFSSHIARLRAIRDIGRKMGRKVVFLGRSLAKYCLAAEDAQITNFKDVKIVKYGNKVKKYLSNLKKSENYLFVVTGHQGEPKATLSKIVDQGYFNFKSGDMVIFSCQIIPVPINFENREVLEANLKDKHVRIFRDIHVSGHASREDHREFFQDLKPEHIIPAHGDLPRMQAMKDLAIQEGWSKDKIHFLKNGDSITLQ